jgi:ABC-2 type transport system permease protein
VTGTWVLVRHFLRRDRWMLLWWSIGITVLFWSQAVSVESLYATQEDFDRAAALMGGNAAFVAMAGPARALNTVGGQVTWQSTAFGAITIGLMSMFIVVRHTRAEEESGRDELLRAAAIGREATTAATVVVAVLANVLVGTLVALSLISFPLAAPDSIALGVGLAAVGLVFTATALLAAQLASSARAAYGLTGVVIGTAYVLRAIGDVGASALSWLSPIGWYQGMHAFSGVRWWPLLLMLALTAAVVTAAVAVFARRDHGSGVIADRAGPARASEVLSTPLGLAWRLQRGPVWGWSAGLFLTGLSYGSLGTDVGDLLGDSATSQEMFIPSGMSLVDGFYATSILMLALLSSAFAIASALRPRHDESSGRVEVLLATGLSRTEWLMTQVVLTTAASALVVLMGGLGLGLGYALTADDWGALARYVGATLTHLAPVLVLSGLGTLAFGVLARWAGVAWLGLLLAAVVLLFGTVFRMPEWLQDLSPFHHLARVPAEDFRWAPFLALVAVALALTATGIALFTRRDIEVR